MCEAALRHFLTAYLADLGTMIEVFKSPRARPIGSGLPHLSQPWRTVGLVANVLFTIHGG